MISNTVTRTSSSIECGLSPKEFYAKYIGLNLNDYISLINAPTADKPYYRSYTVQYLGNVAEGRQVRYVNLPIEELKKAAIAQMKDGEPVWFGCDVGKRSTREAALWIPRFLHWKICSRLTSL